MATCLIIDDVEVTRFTTQQVLNDLGIEGLEAQDANTALDKLAQSKVDAVLLDWHLRKQSGLAMIDQIREKAGKHVPVIVFSGVEDESGAEEAKKAGAKAFVTKPTTREKLEPTFRDLGLL